MGRRVELVAEIVGREIRRPRVPEGEQGEAGILAISEQGVGAGLDQPRVAVETGIVADDGKGRVELRLGPDQLIIRPLAPVEPVAAVAGDEVLDDDRGVAGRAQIGGELDGVEAR
jgi:hypothetical protein